MKLIEVRNPDLGKAIGGGGYGGWNRIWGDELVFQHVLPRIQEGDSVVDLGCGWGRASLPFAISGARITAVDCRENSLDQCRESFGRAGLLAQLEKTALDSVEAFCRESRRRFKVVIASYLLVHLPKSKGIELLEGMCSMVQRDGGYLVVDVPSTLSASYETFRNYKEPVDVDTFMDWCDCTGKSIQEPVAFYHPGEMESMLRKLGGEIICSREEKANSPDDFRRTIVARF